MTGSRSLLFWDGSFFQVTRMRQIGPSWQIHHVDDRCIFLKCLMLSSSLPKSIYLDILWPRLWHTMCRSLLGPILCLRLCIVLGHSPTLPSGSDSPFLPCLAAVFLHGMSHCIFLRSPIPGDFCGKNSIYFCYVRIFCVTGIISDLDLRFFERQ